MGSICSMLSTVSVFGGRAGRRLDGPGIQSRRARPCFCQEGASKVR